MSVKMLIDGHVVQQEQPRISYAKVEVWWWDHSGAPEWQSLAAVEQDNTGPLLCSTVGWLVHQTPVLIVVAQSMSFDTEGVPQHVSDTMKILRSHILQMWELPQ